MESAAGADGGDARTTVRVVLGAGSGTVDTGLPVLDHLLELLSARAGLTLSLEVAPDSVEAELAAAGKALGSGLRDLLRAPGASGHGGGTAVADEAYATAVLEAAAEPRFDANVDFSRERVGGIEGDSISRFLRGLAEAAGITLHVRLVEGQDRQHVLEAIFKALGSALGAACRPERE
jgi:imidazoleglycerol-phosphate dehydratase